MKFKSLFQYIKQEWHFLIVLLAGVAMFFVYAWFPVESARDLYACNAAEGQTIKVANSMLQGGSEGLCDYYGSAAEVFKFNSPDEMMNFFWAERIATGDQIYYQESLEHLGNNLIRPRSVNVIGDRVMPGSFIGLPLIYGTIGSWSGNLGLPVPEILFYLTAFFAVIGIIFFYHLIKIIFNPTVALISSLLAYIFPGWLYYVSRSFYHNVLFVALLIIGLTLLYSILHKAKTKNIDKNLKARLSGLLVFMISGYVIGLSLISRTSEIGWVGLVLLIILIFNWQIFIPNKKLVLSASVRLHHWFGLILFLAFIAVAFIPVFKINYELYGAPLSIGYGTGLSGDFVGLVSQPGLLFKLLVSPFGVDLHSIAVNGYNYLVKFFWLYSIPAVFGLLFWLFSSDQNKKRQLGYLGVMFIVTCYLSFYYGSWQIVDRIDQKTVSIGTSYIRYFLPIYLGMLPFVALLISKIINLIRRTWPKPIIVLLLIFLLAYPGFRLVYVDTDESLLIIEENIHQSQANSIKLRSHIPDDSIVVFGYKQADKIFFPEHKKIIPELAVTKDYEALNALLKHVDLYYYHFADPETAATISRRDFEQHGLKINSETGIKIFGRDWLYKIETIETPSVSEENN